MRSDLSTLKPVVEGFRSRRPRAGAAPVVPRPFAQSEPLDAEIDLDVAAGPEFDLRDTLLRRRSSLQYRDAPVELGPVLRVVRDALARDRDTLGLDGRAGPLEVFVLAARTVRPTPGSFRVTAAGVERLSGPLAPAQLEDLGVQREFAAAAGFLTVCADLAASDGWAGAHGYRVSVSRAAMVAYDTYLRLQARGLTGTLYGGFIATAARRLLQVDGVVRQPLLSLTFAQPLDA